MKNLIGISLLICFIIPFAGTYSWLHYQKRSVRKKIKHEIIAGIEKEELVQLTFTLDETKNELKWKHSKEFEYKNQMYDIVEADTSGNTINYWCWWDHEETKLNKQLMALVDNFLNHHPKKNKQKTQFENFYKTLFYTTKKEEYITCNEPLKHISLYINHYRLFNNPPLPPPPQFI